MEKVEIKIKGSMRHIIKLIGKGAGLSEGETIRDLLTLGITVLHETEKKKRAELEAKEAANA